MVTAPRHCGWPTSCCARWCTDWGSSVATPKGVILMLLGDRGIVNPEPINKASYHKSFRLLFLIKEFNFHENNNKLESSEEIESFQDVIRGAHEIFVKQTSPAWKRVQCENIPGSATEYSKHLSGPWCSPVGNITDGSTVLWIGSTLLPESDDTQTVAGDSCIAIAP